MDLPDPKYRRLCSEATLHTKGGFFPELLSKVTEDIGLAWIDKVFSKEALDKDKIRACCNDDRVWGILNKVFKNIEPIYRKKSAKSALAARLDGDQAQKDGSFQKALILYSQSIIKAPPLNADPSIDDGLSLAKALRARAQVHQMLHRFRASLNDLQFCLEEGFPEPLKYQIYRAMGDAYYDLREDKRAKISWRLALKLLDEQLTRLDGGKGNKKNKIKDPKLKATLQKERSELSALVNSKKESSLLVEETLPPQTLVGPPEISGPAHEKYCNASSLVSIKRTVEHGRFAVATDEIGTGTTIVVEEPYASVLNEDKLGSNCQHCYARLHSPVPCKTCAGVAFCSSTCRVAATYHHYECEFLGLLQGAGISTLAYLSLRMITQEGFQFFKTLQHKIEDLKKGLDQPLTDKESKYVHVYGLTTNQDLRQNEDFFHRAVMAIFLVHCLKATTFFPSPTICGGKLSEDEILAASLILHHLLVLQFNAHELYETRTTAHGRTKGSKAVYIAVGIYPTVALFNHECVPAVTRYFHGKKIVIRSVRPLKKGEVISENYGPIYMNRTLNERIRDLTSRYWFSCECQACKEDWPTVSQLSDAPVRLRCPTPQCQRWFFLPENLEARPRCLGCCNKVSLKDVWKKVSHYQTLYDRGINYMEENSPSMAEQLLTVYLDKIHDLSPPPSKEIALAQQALRSCYSQNGNIWIVNYVRKCLPTIPTK